MVFEYSFCPGVQTPFNEDYRDYNGTSVRTDILDLIHNTVESEGSRRFLCPVSHFESDIIPNFLWTVDLRFQDAALRSYFQNSDSLELLLYPLNANEIIQRSNSSGSISIAHCVQIAMRALIDGRVPDREYLLHFLAIEERLLVYRITRAIKIITIAPQTTGNMSLECKELNHHTFCCIQSGKQYRVATKDLAELQYSFAQLLFHQGPISESCALYSASFHSQVEIFGEDHPVCTPTVGRLGLVYMCAGRHDKALKLFEQSLGMLQKIHGIDHVETVEPLDNLGKVCYAMRRYSEAGCHYEAEKSIKERWLSPDDPKLAETYGNLVRVYLKIGRIDLVACYCRLILGFPHPGGCAICADLLDDLENMARLQTGLRMFKSSIELHEIVIEIKRALFGVDDVRVADAIHNMGVSLLGMQYYDNAMSCFKRALNIYQKDPINIARVANTLQNMGIVFSQQGNQDLAIEYFQRTLQCERGTAKYDMSFASVINNFGVALALNGSSIEALALYKAAVAIARNSYGWNGVDVADMLHNIGVTELALGNLKSSKKHLCQGISIYIAAFGEKHFKSRRARNLLKTIAQKRKLMKREKLRKTISKSRALR